MRNIVLLILLVLGTHVQGQEIARFGIKARKGAGTSFVSVPLNGLGGNPGSDILVLSEVTAAGERKIVCQVEPGNRPVLWFAFNNESGDKRYVLRQIPDPEPQPEKKSLVRSAQGTTLVRAGAPVLTYNHAEVMPPEGVDMKYRRSGFIHPLWSPGGEILTCIQPPDHNHHYGIWNPWTKTTIDGREVDFWNLAKGQGTVKFGGYLDAVDGEVYAGFKACQEHLFFAERGREKVAMVEVWEVRMWKTERGGHTIIDLVSSLNTPLTGGILLNAYRYGGGLGFRATPEWHRENSTLLTSLGKTRAEADGTLARWFIAEGESSVPEGRSGILFLSHPSNRMHPEPLRVWPPDANNGRGDLFVDFCPIRHTEWKLLPGRNYTLKYRLVIFDGNLAAGEAEKYWNAFAAEPLVSFEEK